jgi:hypothetical protein
VTTGTAWKLDGEEREHLLQWISNGKTLVDWVKRPGFPYCRDYVYRILRRDQELLDAYLTARDEGSNAIAEEGLQIIDEPPRTYIDERGNERVDAGYVQWAKNRADMRLKLLSKWNPRLYGDKVTNEISGPNGGPVKIEGVTVKLVRPE